VGDLTSCWDEIHKMLTIELGEIQASFGRNCTILEHKHKSNFLYSELEGYVSRPALHFIFEETKQSKTFNFSMKDCVQKTSYRLPCACILAIKRKKKLHIRLDGIDPHWQRLSVCGEEVDDDFSVMEE